MKDVLEPKFFFEDNIDSFKRGEYLDINLLEKMHNSLHPVKQLSYMETIKNLKNNLNDAKYEVTRDTIYIHIADVDEDDMIYIVRLINFSFKGRKIIVINNKIKYIPSKFRALSLDYILNQVNMIIKREKKNLYFKYKLLSLLNIKKKLVY